MKKAVTTVERRGRDVRYMTSVTLDGVVFAIDTVVSDREQSMMACPPTHVILRSHEDRIMREIREKLFP